MSRRPISPLHGLTFAALLASSALSGPAVAAETASKPEQLIIVSFDGAHDNALWERSLAMAQHTGAHFTYFLSCTYLMSKDEAGDYRAPGHSAGRANIPFAPDREDVAARLGHIWAAHQAGHEIGSHVCGHFDGGKWSKAEWMEEFDSFEDALVNSWSSIDRENDKPEGWDRFATNEVKGFRAPYLSAGPGLYAALEAHGYAYDASGVSRGPEMPDLSAKPARFSLPLIPEGPKGRRVIAMDYNLFARHSKTVETPEKKAEFEARALSAFEAAFKEQYDGKRIPLQLGFHFVEMNGGAYWDALDAFLSETCAKPDVACVSYAQAMERIKSEDRSGS